MNFFLPRAHSLKRFCSLRRPLRIHLLRSRDRFAEFESGQLERRSRNLLERADNRDRIHVIEEADMGDAEDLSLHLALSVGDDGGEAALQFFYDDTRIDACWWQNGGRSCCRRVRPEEL